MTMTTNNNRFALRHYKILAAAVIAFLLFVVILQNAATVEVRILFFSFELPQNLLLFTTGAAGFILGILAALLLKKKGARQGSPPAH